jgi:hypothetical protein
MDEREFYTVYPKDKSKLQEGEVERLIVVAQNNLAEVDDSHAPTLKLVFPDNFQARDFREKLKNYYPNWVMRKLKKGEEARQTKI